MFCIDICAGPGGLSLGLQRAGFDVLGVELDAAAVATHRRNVGPCIHADITTWTPDYEAVLVAGGVPCDSFSSAGKRAGFDDPRGMLFQHLIRIAVAARAECVLLENVARMATSGAIQSVLGPLADAGYAHAQFAVLNAADFGVPQHRRRVFLVAFRSAQAAAAFAWPRATHSEGGLLAPPWVTVREALSLGDQASVDVAYHAVLDAPSPCIVGAENRSALNFGSQGGKTRPRRAGDVLNRALGRRMTLEECGLLQGFPPGFVFEGNRTQQFTQVGDAVPPALGAAVGRQVYAALAVAHAEAA